MKKSIIEKNREILRHVKKQKLRKKKKKNENKALVR